jgi:type IV pilus assembly protein PilN
MIRINLLPREEQPSKAAATWKRVFIWSLIGAVIVVVIGVGLHIFRSYEIASLKSDIGETMAEQEKYKDRAALVQQLTEKRKKISERITVIESLDQNRFLRVHLLDELARSVPEYVWLKSFDEAGGAVALRGVAFSNLAISRFMDSLEAKSHIDSVYLRVIKKEDIQGHPVLGFELGYRIGQSVEGAESS